MTLFSGMYREAESLIVLHQQLNESFPLRDKKSDGWIGDSAHQSRASDHNPWVRDGKYGVVTAIDIDRDLNSVTVSAARLIEAICKSEFDRVKYIIFNRRITKKDSNLTLWVPYHGPSAHLEHIHISVKSVKKFYDNKRPWKLI